MSFDFDPSFIKSAGQLSFFFAVCLPLSQSVIPALDVWIKDYLIFCNVGSTSRRRFSDETRKILKCFILNRGKRFFMFELLTDCNL